MVNVKVEPTMVPVPDNEFGLMHHYHGEAVVTLDSGAVLGYVWRRPLIHEWFWKTKDAQHYGVVASRQQALSAVQEAGRFIR